MKAEETIKEGLKREYKIVVPASEIEDKLKLRLGELAKTARMPGFRPGKVPIALLRKTHGANIMGEVLEHTVNETTQSTISENELRPVSPPKVEITNFEDGQDLKYKIEFEIFPEIKIVDFTKIKLERMKVPASEEEVESTIRKLADSRRETKTISGRNTAAKGDIAVINFVGRVNEVEFDGGKAENYSLEIGSGSFVPGFEEQIIGHSLGEDFEVKVTFPKDYAEDLAGKNAIFEVKIIDLQEAVPPEINEELAKSLGAENLEELRRNIRESHEKELNNFSRMRVKQELLDLLDKEHSFDLPETLVENEFSSIWEQFVHQREHHPEQVDEGDKNRSDEEIKIEYREIASRRLRLGLLLAEIGHVNEVNVTPEEVNRAVVQEAQRNMGQEKETMDRLKNDPQALQALQSTILEEKVVDFIIELADVTDREVTIQELMSSPDKEISKVAKTNQSKSTKKRTRNKKSSVKAKSKKK